MGIALVGLKEALRGMVMRICSLDTSAVWTLLSNEGEDNYACSDDQTIDGKDPQRMIAKIRQKKTDGNNANNGACDKARQQDRQFRGYLSGIGGQRITELQQACAEKGRRAQQEAKASGHIAPQAGRQAGGNGAAAAANSGRQRKRLRCADDGNLPQVDPLKWRDLCNPAGQDLAERKQACRHDEKESGCARAGE